MNVHYFSRPLKFNSRQTSEQQFSPRSLVYVAACECVMLSSTVAHASVVQIVNFLSLCLALSFSLLIAAIVDQHSLSLCTQTLWESSSLCPLSPLVEISPWERGPQEEQRDA